MSLVLLFDDDPLVGDIVRAALEAKGYVVGIRLDAQDIVRIVEAKQPALVILDCVMPGIPGTEALRRLRSSKRCFNVPVLMLTARSSRSDEEIALRAGASDYLRKPFDVDQLTVTVDSLIRHSQPVARARQSSFGTAARRV